MNRLLKIELKNVVLFKEVTIDIEDNNGFVVIHGINRDSNIADNSNGAGKSLLFSSLPVAAYESDPLSLIKNNKKVFHENRGSVIGLTVQNSNSPHEAKLEQVGSKYKFYLDGEDQKAQKGTIARDLFSKHWTLSPEEFYATSYIQSQRNCPFQKAKAADRLSFITNLFDLHFFDLVRAQFATRLSKIKDKEIEFQALSAELQKLERELNGVQWDKRYNAELKELQSSVEKDRKDIEELYSERNAENSKVTSYKKLLELFKSLQEIVDDGLGDFENLPDLTHVLEDQVEYMEQQESYDAKLKKFHQRKQKLEQEVGELAKGLEDLSIFEQADSMKDSEIDSYMYEMKSNIKEMLEERAEIEDKLKEHERVARKIDKIIGELNELGYDSIAAAPKSSPASEISNLQMIVDIAKDLDGHENCPTCLQSLDIKKLQANAKRARAKLPELEDAAEAYELAKRYKEIVADTDADTEDDSLNEDLEELNGEIKQEQSFLEEWEIYVRSVEDLKRLSEIIESLEPPAKPKGKITYPDLSIDRIDELLDDLEYYDEQFSKAKSFISNLDSISRKNKQVCSNLLRDSKFTKLVDIFSKLTATANSELDSIAEDIADINENLERDEKRLIALENAKSNWQVLTNLKMDTEGKLAEAQPIIKEKKIVETLYKAYGNSNLKLQHAIRIMKLIESNLNRFSHMVFPETMQFKMEAGTKGIEAIAIRKNGKISDISRLSGAETNCFRLLFAISVLPLLPSNRRTNFMVLDEPDSACSDAVREHLAKEFLPKLRTLVPHIFWITPKSTDLFKEAEIWTVEKKDGTSTLNRE